MAREISTLESTVYVCLYSLFIRFINTARWFIFFLFFSLFDGKFTGLRDYISVTPLTFFSNFHDAILTPNIMLFNGIGIFYGINVWRNNKVKFLMNFTLISVFVRQRWSYSSGKEWKLLLWIYEKSIFINNCRKSSSCTCDYHFILNLAWTFEIIIFISYKVCWTVSVDCRFLSLNK